MKNSTQNVTAMQTKIVISVKGGAIQAIHSSEAPQNLDVIVIDYDNIEQGDKMSDEQEQAEKEVSQNQLYSIY